MTIALPLLDVNIFVRHLRQNHADHSPRASAYIARIETGELTAKTNALVLFETVYVLQSIYRMTKAEVARALLGLVALPHLKIPNKARLRRTFAWYVRYNLSFVDAYLAAMAHEQQLPALISFDRNDDRIPGIPRMEP